MTEHELIVIIFPVGFMFTYCKNFNQNYIKL